MQYFILVDTMKWKQCLEAFVKQINHRWQSD